MNLRSLFLQHNAQTSMAPLAVEFVKASCASLYNETGKEYIDLIGGISVANVGHSHPKVVQAVQEQAARFMHTMVYGEVVLAPQVTYAKLLADHLPLNLQSVYFTNSGAEAIEAALKLAKRKTNRTQIFAFNNSYHGSTHGALSVLGSEYWRNAFRPLLPDVHHFEFNNDNVLNNITEKTACVLVEPVQAEQGVVPANKTWMQALANKCKETDTLLIMDAAQTAFGRTGTLWGFENYNIVPDVLVLAKALGGGMPMGAVISSKTNMDLFASQPVLGHITTFGGHPVCCAAGQAAFEVLLTDGWIEQGKKLENILHQELHHHQIKKINSCGLWAGVFFKDFETNKKIIDFCLQQGVFTDWFLFAPEALRISPPLIISEVQLVKACNIIKQAADNL
jgi:acetylornithine/N-succinyldiaminopimelate aminotransferase